MLGRNIFSRRRDIRQTSRSRAYDPTASRLAVCEALEARRLLTQFTFFVPPNDGYEAVYLRPGLQQGWVDVHKNSESGSVEHTFKGDNDEDGTGMYIVDAGSLSNFIFVDQVSQPNKPTASPGTPGDNGILVLASTGNGGRLIVEDTRHDSIIKVTEATSTSGTVTVTGAFGSPGHSRFGAGVDKLTIQTFGGSFTGTYVYAATRGFFPEPDLPGIPPEISLHIESLGANDRIELGGADDASVHATIRTGKGNNTVLLLQDKAADGTTTAIIDFDPTLGGGLGAGNRLELGKSSVGSGMNCTATLKRRPGTSHVITLDQVYLIHGASPAPNADAPPTVIIEDETRIGEARLYQDALPTVLDEDPIVLVNAPLTVERTMSGATVMTTGIVYLGGRMDFAHTSEPSTVYKFERGIKKDENPFELLSWGDSRGVVNVEAGELSGADLKVQTDSRIAFLNIPGNGKFTLQERDAEPTVSDARVLLLKSLDMGNDPDNPEGLLDLNDNGLIVDHDGTSPQAYIRSLIVSAYNTQANPPGDWSGTGITSSLGDNNRGVGYAENDNSTDGVNFSTFLGQAVDSTSVLVRYTLYGDTNLDGTVNLADFNKLAGNFGQSDKLWVHGDSTYDGNVNLADFNKLAANFGQSVFGEGEGDGLMDGGDDEGNYTYEDLLQMLMELHPEHF